VVVVAAAAAVVTNLARGREGGGGGGGGGLFWSSVFRSGPVLRVGGEGGGGGGGAAVVVRRRPFLEFKFKKTNCHISGDRHTDTHRQALWAIGNDPPLYAHVPCPFFEATPPGAAPGPPVKTGARVRRFRRCKQRRAPWFGRPFPFLCLSFHCLRFHILTVNFSCVFACWQEPSADSRPPVHFTPRWAPRRWPRCRTCPCPLRS